MEFWGHGGVAHFGISEGKGGLKHGSRPWLGMDIFWNCPMFLFINFFYCYRKSISIFDCYQIAILNILITDINYYFIDWLHLVLNFMYFNYFSQLCRYNWHQCHWGGRIKAQFRRRTSAVPNLIVIWFDCSMAGKQLWLIRRARVEPNSASTNAL